MKLILLVVFTNCNILASWCRLVHANSEEVVDKNNTYFTASPLPPTRTSTDLPTSENSDQETAVRFTRNAENNTSPRDNQDILKVAQQTFDMTRKADKKTVSTVRKPIPKYFENDSEDDFQTKVIQSAHMRKITDSGEHEDVDFNLNDYEFDINHDEFTVGGGRKPLETRKKTVVKNKKQRTDDKKADIISKLESKAKVKREQSGEKEEYDEDPTTTTTKAEKVEEDYEEEEYEDEEEDQEKKSKRTERSPVTRNNATRLSHILPMFPTTN